MADPVVAILEKIVKIGLKIKAVMRIAGYNHEGCSEIGRCVLRCSSTLWQLRQAGAGMVDASRVLPAATRAALEGLQETLERALLLLVSCQPEERSTTIPRLVAAMDLSGQLRGVTEDISNKSIQAALANYARLFIFSTETQDVGYPVTEEVGSGSSYRPYISSSSTSGTIVSSNYTSSALSSQISILSTEVAMLVLGLDFGSGDEDDAEFIKSIQE